MATTSYASTRRRRRHSAVRTTATSTASCSGSTPRARSLISPNTGTRGTPNACSSTTSPSSPHTRSADMRGLESKTVVIAGGAGGIGTATSVRLAADGANVVVADLDPDAAAQVVKEIEQQGGTAIATHVDISDEASVQALV